MMASRDPRSLDAIAMCSINASSDTQLDSVNSAAGSEPPEVLQAFNDKLFVSPVVPALATHVGAWVVPDATAILTSIEEPLLNTASDPSPSPMILNSDSVQSVARSTTLSLPVVLYASVSVVNTRVSLPFFTAEPESFRCPSSAISCCGTVTAALFL